eukprot:12845550-Ditylum_brightwellii.AAC.1
MFGPEPLQWQDVTSKKLLIIYLPQVGVTIDNDGDTDKERITGPTSNAVGKLQSFSDLPAHLMEGIIKFVPEIDAANLPLGDDDLCIVGLPSVIPVSQAQFDRRLHQHASVGTDGELLL